MPIYKAKGKKNGLQKYRVIVNYTDTNGEHQKIERAAYGKDEAREIESRLQAECNDKTYGAKITLQELYNEYIVAKKNSLRATTLDKAKRTLSAYVLPQLGKYKLNKLTVPLMGRWKTNIENEKKKDGSAFTISYKRKIFSVFRTLLNYAVQMEYMPRNPLSKAGNFEDANVLKNDKGFNFYEPEDFIKFRNAARLCAEQEEQAHTNIYEWYYYVFFCIAYYTGMRKGEINALRWVDVSGDIIHITRSITQKLKGPDVVTPPKNGRERDIQIPLPLKTVLDEHYTRCKSIAGFKDTWYICGGTHCIRDTTTENRNKKYAKIAKIKKIKIHEFRHSHASLLAHYHINIQEISRRLGHKNIEITWNTYSHLYPREIERAIEILNQIN